MNFNLVEQKKKKVVYFQSKINLELTRFALVIKLRIVFFASLSDGNLTT